MAILNSPRGKHVYTLRLYVICILMFITLSGCQKKIIADSTSTASTESIAFPSEQTTEESAESEEMVEDAENEFVPTTNNDQIDNKIKENLSEEEKSNVDLCGWIDDAKECYQIGIRRSEDVEGEYRHLKDYFFVKKDDTVKTLEVTYPSKSDDPFSDRYPLDVCEFDAVYQDVSFDGNKDIVISLGNSKYSSIHCAYVYESGEFQYKKSFENIPDYVVDEKSNSILGRERSSFYQYKYMNGQFQPVINDDSLEPIIEKYIALNDDCSIYSKEWVDSAKECYRLQIQRFNKEKGTEIHDGDIFFIKNKDRYEGFDISYPYDESDTTTTERVKDEYTWDDTDISCSYVDKNNDGIKEIVITITNKNENKPEKYAFQYNEFGNWDRIN